MTNDELERLEALISNTTPGHWQFWTSNSWRRLIASDFGNHRPVIMPTNHPVDRHEDLIIRQADMDYIEAVQPSAVLHLIKEIRNLRDALARMEEATTATSDIRPKGCFSSMASTLSIEEA